MALLRPADPALKLLNYPALTQAVMGVPLLLLQALLIVSLQLWYNYV